VKIEGIDVEQVLETARTALQHDTQLSPTLRSAVEILLILVTVLLNRITLDSRNSSIPPSQDRHRTHTSRRGETGRTPGGQPGRKGVTLMPVANPDEVHVLSVDRGTLPQERCYREVGYDLR
jgi:transposase